MVKVCLNCGETYENINSWFCPKCKKALKTKGYWSWYVAGAGVFMIISCIIFGILLVPLIWLIPMTIKIFKRRTSIEKLSMFFKIGVLLLGNFLAGVLLICDDEAWLLKLLKNSHEQYLLNREFLYWLIAGFYLRFEKIN